MAAELGGRRLQLLKDLIPDLRRVAVLASSQDAFTRPFLSYMQTAAESGGLQLDPVMATGPPDFEPAFADIGSRRAGATIIQGVFNTQHTAILELAARYRMPTMWFDRPAIMAGGLISLSVNTDEIFRVAAGMVDKVLKGAKPADLPVEQPSTFVNLKTTRALGLTVPAPILVQATEIVE